MTGRRAVKRRPWTHKETMTIRTASFEYVRTRNASLIALHLHGRASQVTARFRPDDLPRLFDVLGVRPDGEYMGLNLLEGRRVTARFTSIVGPIIGVGPVDADDEQFIATCV